MFEEFLQELNDFVSFLFGQPFVFSNSRRRQRRRGWWKFTFTQRKRRW
jgi:hypothetical protein